MHFVNMIKEKTDMTPLERYKIKDGQLEDENLDMDAELYSKRVAVERQERVVEKAKEYVERAKQAFKTCKTRAI